MKYLLLFLFMFTMIISGCSEKIDGKDCPRNYGLITEYIDNSTNQTIATSTFGQYHCEPTKSFNIGTNNKVNETEFYEYIEQYNSSCNCVIITEKLRP